MNKPNSLGIKTRPNHIVFGLVRIVTLSGARRLGRLPRWDLEAPPGRTSTCRACRSNVVQPQDSSDREPKRTPTSFLTCAMCTAATARRLCPARSRCARAHVARAPSRRMQGSWNRKSILSVASVAAVFSAARRSSSLRRPRAPCPIAAGSLAVRVDGVARRGEEVDEVDARSSGGARAVWSRRSTKRDSSIVSREAEHGRRAGQRLRRRRPCSLPPPRLLARTAQRSRPRSC